MPKALMLLRTLDDVRYAAGILGLPLELVPQVPLRADHERIRVSCVQDMETAYRQLCDINIAAEFTAIRS
jgi:hypothetical protein